MNQANKTWAPILDFWFPDQSSQTKVPDKHMRLWFQKRDETDRTIKDEFGALVEKALNGDFPQWHEDPHGRLAKIILLDQLTRNIFRGKPKSFAGDAMALDLAISGIDAGMDQAVPPNQRPFFYMPLEHDETIANQNRCLDLMAALVDEAPKADKSAYQSFYDFAVKHRDVIVRFGRFPHRNAILGRTSTREERDFLDKPGSSF